MKLIHTATRNGKLLTFLRREMEISSSLVKRLKWHNGFLVNGMPVHTDHLVKVGDVIVADLAEEQPDFPAETDPIDILYEDDCLLAVDKPPGLLMHPTFYRMTGTLANRLLGYYAATGQSCAVHPVSRLDRDTFGVTLFAKNAHIHGKMVQAHKDGAVQKTYEALVVGAPLCDQGTWEWPIGRCGGESLLREVSPDGQYAKTNYRVLHRCGSYSLLQLEPVTGRTHQLRVHCAYAGCPIVADPQYGGETAQYPGLHHQQLCASMLELMHPVTGAQICIRSRQQCAVAVVFREECRA